MPKPQIRWIKQGMEIKQSHEYHIEEMEDGTSILIIPEVYQDDTGEIVFEAYNPLGVTSTIAALSVESESYYETYYFVLIFLISPRPYSTYRRNTCFSLKQQYFLKLHLSLVVFQGKLCRNVTKNLVRQILNEVELTASCRRHKRSKV